MGRVANQELGISRPASAFAWYYQKCRQDHKKVQDRKRLTQKTFGKSPMTKEVAARWHEMSPGKEQSFVLPC